MNVIDKNTFLRSFKVLPDDSYDLLLGSGASVNSGIPTGGELIWHFKREIFCVEKGIHTDKYRDLQIEANRKQIQQYFEDRGDGDKEIKNEYSHYFEECYPDPLVREEYIKKLVRDKKPSIGFLCLSALISNAKINTIWTTNFDDLTEKALNKLDVSCSLISPENSNSVNKYKEDDLPKIVKLHGDFRYDNLQNTDDELQQLENNLQGYLLDSARSKGLIVLGYSGSDKSIMDTLKKALEHNNAFPKGLIWCIPKGITPSNELVELIVKANEINKRSGFIEIDNFDYFMYEMYKVCGFENEQIDKIEFERFEQRKSFRIEQSSAYTTPVLLNTIKAESFPKSVFSTKTNLNGWAELREIIKGNKIIGSLHKGNALFWGDEEEITKVFQGRLQDELKLIDIPEYLFYHSDSVYLGMLYDLIEHSLIKDYELNVFKKGQVRKAYSSEIKIKDTEIELIKKWNRSFSIPSNIEVYEAFEFKLEIHNKQLFLLICPTIHLIKNDGTEIDREQAQYLSNTILSNRYNKAFSEKLTTWLKYLKEKVKEPSFKLDSFEIKLSSFYATAGTKTAKGIHNFDGLKKINEPKIYFHHNDINVSAIHPVSALKELGPLEESYGTIDGVQKINLGIISPDFGFKRVLNHLQSLTAGISPKSEKDYLKDYAGFDQIYKKHLEIQQDPENELNLIIPDKDVEGLSAIQFYDYLKSCIDRISINQNSIDCLIIYIPDRWKKFRELKTEGTYFDLHDSIKIYCVKKGLKIQFIEDKSINYYDQAKIRWWLSLGLYVKSNATPWKIKTDDLETAFIGLGYAVRRNAKQRIVLGSSQMFDSNGNGLKFMMQPIENPKFFDRNKKNPFMSKEDAFRLVANIRNTYNRIDPNIGLKKLVIHKTTRFTKDEIEGISNALEGVDNIELLQIQQYSYWRAIKLFKDRNTGKHKPFGYPIERGTIIQLDDFSFLLWTHGLVQSPEFEKPYYQGKRGIPVPVLITRFRGTDSIESVANDILKLTKMNWNGAELYKSSPVTIDFSKKLSVMGKQAEELTNRAYDFRYFI